MVMVVKIQSLIRGYLSRRKLKVIKFQNTAYFENIKVVDDRGQRIMSYNNDLVKVSQSISPHSVPQRVRAELGDFNYTRVDQKFDRDDERDIEFRPMF